MVVIFTGIFKAARTSDEIAVILGHEIAHILAHHGEADLSAYLFGGAVALPVIPFVVGACIIPELVVVAAPTIALGTLITLALSRQRETEADEMGMLIMTEAGFDPSATVSFWNQMKDVEQAARDARGQRERAQYQSTHPHVSEGSAKQSL